MSASRLTTPAPPAREPSEEVTLLSGLAAARPRPAEFGGYVWPRGRLRPDRRHLVRPVRCRRPDKLAWSSLAHALGWFAQLRPDRREGSEVYPCGSGPVHWHVGRPTRQDATSGSTSRRRALMTYERLALERLGEEKS